MSETFNSAIRDHIWFWMSAFTIIVAFVIGHATGRAEGLKVARGGQSGGNDLDFRLENKIRRRYQRACRLRARRENVRPT